MASIFTKIINGDIPAYKVAETDKFLAFLDIFPVQKGHTLVIPKEEIDDIHDLDDKTFGELYVFAKHIAIAIKKAFPCKKVSQAVIGLEVPHAHLHLIPINAMSDVNFDKKLKLSEDELEEVTKKIKAELQF